MWEALGYVAASVIGGLLANRSSSKAQETANQTNVNLNEENRAWMENLSNTSYQRAVKDMSAAGLNPMLAYSQGGASTPSSAAPVVAPVPRMGQAVGEGIQRGSASALQATQMMQSLQSVEQSKATTDQLRAQIDKIRSETMSNELNTAAKAAEVNQTVANTQRQAAETNTEYERRKLTSQQAEKVANEILGVINESAWKHSAYEAMKSGGGFEADVRRRKAEATLSELDIPRSKAEAGMYGRTGGDLIPYIGPLMQLIGGASSARRAFGGTSHSSTFEVIK